jgi:predicted kinase
MKVILTRGLPGSGKSTWAKEKVRKYPNQYKRINKDDLRRMLDADGFRKDMEKYILDVRDNLILLALEKGKHVIVDDTNLSPKHENRIREVVRGKAKVIIQDFTDVPLDECIKRDLNRLNSVGESKIKQMYFDHIYKKTEYVEDNSLPKCIIVDIDGTLAKMEGRSPFEWDRVMEDAVNEPIKKIVNSYNGKIIIFSGRDGSCKKETKKWLKKNGIKHHNLYLREEGNMERDSIVKRRMFEENIRGKFYVEFVLDDRNQVVDMWRRDLGLTCLQVDYGNF